MCLMWLTHVVRMQRSEMRDCYESCSIPRIPLTLHPGYAGSVSFNGHKKHKRHRIQETHFVNYVLYVANPCSPHALHSGYAGHGNPSGFFRHDITNPSCIRVSVAGWFEFSVRFVIFRPALPIDADLEAHLIQQVLDLG